jgi:signal transduction histidine kinase
VIVAVLSVVFGFLAFLAADMAVDYAMEGHAGSQGRFFAGATAAAAVMLFALFVLAVFRRMVIRPLKALGERAERAAPDMLDFMPAELRDEIGDLSASLAKMTSRMREDRDRIAAQLVEISRQKKAVEDAQAQLVRAEKLAVVGRLAAGIAHEVGSPLSAVLGYIDLMRADLKSDAVKEQGTEFLDRMEKEVNRINRIVRELLDYSRPARYEMQDIVLRRAVEEVLALMKPQQSFKEIDISFEQEKNGIRVWADWDRLRQVLMNLLFNAADSITGPGLITIRASPAEGGMAALSIMDNGKGIPPEEIEKIFEPFYTTKVPGQGTGLGLAVSQKIVESMGGRVAVESTPGRGSVFTILLREGGADGSGQ